MPETAITTLTQSGPCRTATGEALTIVEALSTKGVPASMTIEAATDTDVFLTFAQQVLSTTLMDNLPALEQAVAEGCAL